MNNQNLKKRMYGIGMGEGYVYVSIANLLIYFILQGSSLYGNLFIGANVTIALVGIGLYLYSRYIMKVKDD